MPRVPLVPVTPGPPNLALHVKPEQMPSLVLIVPAHSPTRLSSVAGGPEGAVGVESPPPQLAADTANDVATARTNALGLTGISP